MRTIGCIIRHYGRIAEFTIGAVLANIYIIIKNKKYNYNKFIMTLVEVLAIINPFWVISNAKMDSFFYVSFAYVIPILILLLIFSIAKGYISKIISWRPLFYLGGLSVNMFLTHDIIIVFIAGHNYLNLTGPVLVFVMLLITIILNWAYTYLLKVVNNLIKNRRNN